MFYKAKSGRDALTSSLGGMNTISSFTISPVIAEDRADEVLDERVRRTRDDRPQTSRAPAVTRGRLWLRRRRQAA